MVLNKHDLISDGIADLYRAAFYLAKGSNETGLQFVSKAKEKLGNKISFDTEKLLGIGVLNNEKDCLLWAEKVLDEHKRLKMILSSK